MSQTAGAAIFAQARIAHDFDDIGQVPAHEIRWMTERAVKPFERRLHRPRFREEPPVVGVIVRFDRVEFAEFSLDEMIALAGERFEETRTLSDHDAASGAALRFE